jgi:hypothetical protein
MEQSHFETGRKGKFWVDQAGVTESYNKKKKDLEKRNSETMKLKQEIESYGLAGELKGENKNEKSSLSAVEINAITEDLRLHFINVEAAAKNLKFSGLDSVTTEKLKDELRIVKQDVLRSSGITKETYQENTQDKDDVKRAKAILKTAVEYVENL